MSRQNTVVEQKRHFLQLRKQFLTRGIVPSEKLKRIATEGGVELSVLKGALDKVNRELKQHSRKVYSRQMTEHVTEQIDEFYGVSRASDRDRRRDLAFEDTVDGARNDDETHTLYRTDDLTQDEHISRLPIHWDTSADTSPHSYHDDEDGQVDPAAYTEALENLQGLSAKRLMLQERLNTYRTLLTLLEPYRRPKESVQPNLIWRDAPITGELGKTRTLAVRVAARVGKRRAGEEAPATMEGEDPDMWEDEGRAKVNRVLESW